MSDTARDNFWDWLKARFARASADRDDIVRPRFSALTRRIIFFNAFALVVLVAGVLWVQATRVSLVDERISGIREQALIVAGALAEYAADPEIRDLEIGQAEPLLRQLIAPTRLRARIYSKDGTLLIDTRFLLARNVVQTVALPAPGTAESVWAFLRRLYDSAMGVRPFAKLQPYFEAGQDGRVYEEVVSALADRTDSTVRVSEQDKLVLSVAAPIKRFATLYGVLLLTTEGGDIDDILKEERTALLEVFLVAFGALLLSSLYLAGFIAQPIRKLATAADRVRRGRAGREPMPVLVDREDEIGELALSFSAMTRALYDRIDTIERFAADVAHELKNPLTSLRSAVEMLARAEDANARARLTAVVREDVRRIDRLITDISGASRLDAELSRERTEPVDIGRLLETIVEVYRLTELPEHVTLKLDLDFGASRAIVQGLAERLGQVFRNLIDNAISFSPKVATVTIGARIEGSNVRAFVDDEGPGIPEGNLERVFERFYTERPSEHGFGTNSGLGLAIARQIVESHGGYIRAQNRAALDGTIAGARFVVALPLGGGRA